MSKWFKSSTVCTIRAVIKQEFCWLEYRENGKAGNMVSWQIKQRACLL
uniref:SRT901 n=1 Tax=Arundo donax TaxID=35708 RepID=A0A0A9DGC1_ARUDO